MAKFCKKCGTKIDPDERFCSECGHETGNVIGNSDMPVYVPVPEKKARKNRKEKPKKKKRILLKLIAMLLALLIVSGGVVGILTYFSIIDIPIINSLLVLVGFKQDEKEHSSDSNDADNPNSDDDDDPAQNTYEVTPLDTDEYFQNNSTIIAEFDINTSSEVRTQAETYSNLADRGFAENPITTEYAMDGTYYEATEISNSSSSKHPIYETFYISANGDYWLIMEINGTIAANPLSYNDQSNLDVLVVISETTTVTSYDGTTNKFYETIPNESALIVKTVSRIDAETLDNLTFGGIDAL